MMAALNHICAHYESIAIDVDLDDRQAMLKLIGSSLGTAFVRFRCYNYYY
jgi:hypothetical protein